MDPRWHTNHDSETAGLDSQRPANWPSPIVPGAFFQAERESDFYPPPSEVLASDVRFFHSQIAKLRQLLASAKVHQAQQVDEIRRTARQAFARQESDRVNQIAELKRQIQVLEHEGCEAAQNHEQQLAILRAKLDWAQQMNRTSASKIDVLKQEFENLARTASTEQRELAERHRAFADRHQRVIDDKDDSIQTLEAEIAENEDSLIAWQIAHEQAVLLCQWLQDQQLESRNKIQELHSERERFHTRASEAFAICDDEIEMLEATVAILRTDHETVELIAADLDHRNDELQCTIHELQSDLDSLVKTVVNDRQESLRVMDAINAQLHSTNARLKSVSEEKISLLDSIAQLKAASDDFDAALFAKDQEIDATKRVAHKAQEQLEMLRREQVVVAGQNDQMRNQIREAAINIARLESERSTEAERADQAESTVAERDRQLREIQSSARAAEANAILRTNEAECHFATELERLETELGREREVDEREAQAKSELIAKLAELEGSLVESQLTATASSAEKDRLQSTIDQLTEQLAQSQFESAKKDQLIASREAVLEEIRSEASETVNQVQQMRMEIDNSQNQLTEYADRIEVQQIEISDYQEKLAQAISQLAQANNQLEQTTEAELTESDEEIEARLQSELFEKWHHRVQELEQNQVAIRERHQQENLAQQRAIDSINESVRELTMERDRLTSRLDEANAQNVELKARVTDLAVYENPINEVNRLTTELAKRIADHARERDSLFGRIEQLQTSRLIARAA